MSNAAVGFNYEDIEILAEMIFPLIHRSARGERVAMNYNSFRRSFESLQDFCGNDRVEARYRARYISELAYKAADYSVQPSKFKSVLNLNLQKQGYKAGQKGAQTTVEHSIPRKFMFDTLVQMWKNKMGLTVKEIADFIYNHNEVAVLTYEEDNKLTSAGFRETTPDIKDKFARYKAANIKIVDAQTGEYVC